MHPLSEDGRRILTELAARHGISLDAATHMLMAVANGGGTQAQFNHPEVGGMGQWSRGGMIMIGDMFNNGLKAKVDWLCQELSDLLGSQPAPAPVPQQMQSQNQWPNQGQGQSQGYGQSQQQGGGYGQFQGQSSGQQGGGTSSLFVSGGTSMSSGGWPGEFGHPSAVGSQNNLRYAFFPSSRRLVIEINGQQTTYDTGDHQISGFGQQQSGDQSLTFTSQFGLVRVADLPQLTASTDRQNGSQQTHAPANGQPAEMPAPAPMTTEPVAQEPFVTQSYTPTRPADISQPTPAAQPAQTAPLSDDEIFAKIERLAALHAKGVLTDEEYSSKKADLLGRL
ncbi:Short C-terminal domain-containing protein [Rhizobium sp. RU20A]|uniref:SHOCT domain-containing protein n=1 Tax=Rhizobium sp. RU20A TaxID=1907412 RepID=UPI00095692CD|nr:SHOCT domain-containing protein [Rhizobium sp. RU20A]SIQ32876.1 Short C-terminal domain-containing protein [Rhizobium sp. RU20A]